MTAQHQTIKVTGLRELRRNLREAADRTPRELTRTNKAVAAEVVVPEAKRLVPHLTGRLGKSIRALASQSKARVAAGRVSVPYAGVIHFGWPAHHIEPQPFLYEAVDRRRREVIDRYLQLVDRLTNKPFPEGGA